MVRQSFDIDTKKKILDEIEKGTPYSVIQTDFNLKSYSNISEIKRNKAKILESYNSNDSPLRKSLKKTKFETIDKSLFNFINNCNDKGVPINSRLLREKAIQVSKEAGFADFKASKM